MTGDGRSFNRSTPVNTRTVPVSAPRIGCTRVYSTSISRFGTWLTMCPALVKEQGYQSIATDVDLDFDIKTWYLFHAAYVGDDSICMPEI